MLCVKEIVKKWELEDGYDEMLNNVYENIRHSVEKQCLNDQISNEEKNNIKSELDDGCDEILNNSYDEITKNHRTKKVSLIPKNLLYLVQNSKKEIKRNHLLAKIRLMETKRRSSFKSKMSDFFYNFELWPNFAIGILFSRDLGYEDRNGLATFFHGNGLRDSEKALEIFMFYNKYWNMSKDWRIAFRKFHVLFEYLDKAYQNTDEGSRIRNKYFYYDVNLKLTVFYNGNVREANGDERTYVPLRRYN